MDGFKTRTIETIIMLISISVLASVGQAVSLSIYADDSLSFLQLVVDGILATFILAVISLIGFLIGQLPYLKKAPIILWVSLLSAYASSPFFPYNDILVEITEDISMLAISVPLLAYVGLGLGNDIMQFKTVSWRIIPVALAILTGTFLVSAVFAQFTLSWEGII